MSKPETNKPDLKQDLKNNLIKEGRRPISQKRAASELSYDDMFGNSLQLDPELKRELDEKGLVPRFVDAKRLYEMNGYNSKGWRTYRRERKPSDTIDALEFKFGNDPSGVIRRGSLILAVKTKEQAERHRAFLNHQAEKQSEVAKEKADELRLFAKKNGLNAEIFEGYEENEAPGI